ncbi:uncharacterized protein LOC113509259 isoform X2 [Galleria mellonella]|uniref:Uncharacterized protein LOC113509259 isoform X2 n=1 Tax=Galleria mellonella TaxID=7137 RepID=A0ABM3MNE3_GALME|nr:uncharacterized protein LOC113509259 isoform X2 [Galleria mellonella]
MSGRMSSGRLLVVLATAAVSAAVAAPHTDTDYCHQLDVKLNNELGGGRAERAGRRVLLLAALRHGLRYRGLRLRRARSLHHIAHTLSLAPAFAAHCGSEEFWDQMSRWARVRVAGAGAARAGRRLLVRLAPRARTLPPCASATRWPRFYGNTSLLRLCMFSQNYGSESAVLYAPPEWNITALHERTIVGSRLTVRLLDSNAEPRHQLVRLLQGNTSFLFLDYNIWGDVPSVRSVRAVTSERTFCESSLESDCSFRLATNTLQKFAPPLYNVMQRFNPLASDLRKVLELETRSANITEAACAWALSDSDRFKSWFREYPPAYRAVVFLCKNEEYDDAVLKITKIMERRMTRFRLEVWKYYIKCESEYDSMRLLQQLNRSLEWSRTLGVLAAGEGVAAAAQFAAAADVALVCYDTAPPAALGRHARGLGAHPRHLLAALQRLLADCRWKRLGVLSEDSHLARSLIDGLVANSDLLLYNIPIKHDTLEYSLDSLREANARIIFLNTDVKKSLSIVCEAFVRDMTRDSGYIWILREWYGDRVPKEMERTCYDRMTLYTISFWWRGGDLNSKRMNSSDEAMRLALDDLWPHRPWPRLAAPLADGLILLLNSFNNFIEKYPSHQYDLHARNVTHLIWESLKGSVLGVTQNLYANQYAAAEPIIFVEEWRGTERLPLAVCDINSCSYMTRSMCPSYEPPDGPRPCLTNNSEYNFVQHCNDLFWIISVIIIILSMTCIYVARHLRMKNFKNRNHKNIDGLSASGERAAAKLADHLVDRTALEFHQEIGAGRFGRVRFAILRAPNRPILPVAVKSLRDDAAPAEEIEFLGEACTLASLRHEHIVRLIGVCATGGPPLLLMEYVFFGDLRGYLRERRHLVEYVDGEIPEEAMHVSSYALTKLAREASLALAYLTKRQLVHRDVRASNCLIDARRSLKLADFGMARETMEYDGAAEYACRRRGFFPALWMAPESLDRGVFSPATDVWALGVLMLEMVTLGERPYGTWSPLRVLRYVSAGGRPPLPPNASLKTRGVLLSCWRRAPEQRPTSSKTAAYLDANPLALSPTLGMTP